MQVWMYSCVGESCFNENLAKWQNNPSISDCHSRMMMEEQQKELQPCAHPCHPPHAGHGDALNGSPPFSVTFVTHLYFLSPFLTHPASCQHFVRTSPLLPVFSFKLGCVQMPCVVLGGWFAALGGLVHSPGQTCVAIPDSLRWSTGISDTFLFCSLLCSHTAPLLIPLCTQGCLCCLSGASCPLQDITHPLTLR